MARYRSRRRSRRTSTTRPLIGFLLVASFGILFAGCSAPVQDIPQADEFSFTEEDVARFREIVGTNGSGGNIPRLELPRTGTGDGALPTVDLSLSGTYNTIRGSSAEEKDTYRVTNEFVNVRSEPTVAGSQIGRLEKSAPVEVIEFIDAAWAKVRFQGGEGYLSNRYISKIVSEEQLAAEKKEYEGLYFVDFGFLNVRKDADSQSEKLGELPGQAFVRPLSMDDIWARIPFEDGEGYIATQYLSPFLPNLLVRQSTFPLPTLQYRADIEGGIDAMIRHVDRLKQEGYTLWTLRDFYNVLLQQEDRDVRVPPKTVALGVSGITPTNLVEVTDALRASGVNATLFISSQYVGAGGITEQQLQTISANGHDIQSGGHTGDDLRSLTNAQVELELAQSRALLEQLTDRTIYAIAYPLGGVNERVASLAADAGYLLGVGQARQTTFNRDELLRMPSFLIEASLTSDELLRLLE